MRPLRVFISYARADAHLLDELLRHCGGLSRNGLVHFSTDRDIEPGEAWEAFIERQLASADLVLLLVTANFVSSAYCRLETNQALASQASRGTQVIPILMEPVDLALEPICSLQFLPRQGGPVPEGGRNRQECLAGIAKDLRAIAVQRRALLETEELNREGVDLSDLGHPVEAVELFERALAIMEENGSIGVDGLSVLLSNLALAHQDSGDLQKALDLAERALGLAQIPESRARRLIDLAGVLLDLGNAPRALVRAREALLHLAVDRSAPWARGKVIEGHALRATGKAREAGASFRAVLDCAPEHPRHRASAETGLAALALDQGDRDGAQEHLAQAASLHVQVYGSDHPIVAADLANLGVLRQALHIEA
jgi:tetratricopeptide (TPR) repeat protein